MPVKITSPLSEQDHDLLHKLRSHSHTRRRKEPERASAPHLGERAADWAAERIGSWRFILMQSALLALWIAINSLAWIRGWDPYPFILLNLVLSFQAAYTAPIIMISQNRAAVLDRQRAEDDYRVNLKAELEIELLHHKMDLMREQEIAKLIETVDLLAKRLDAKSR